jgi:uncharacterized protein YbbK (DUF523 family)
MLSSLPIPTQEAPLRILLSHCLTGAFCGYDGSNYDGWAPLKRLVASNVRLLSFCPEEVAFGTPRELCDIHGGDGYDVLDGKAKVVSTSGEDWSARMLKGAQQMLQLAQMNKAQVCIMTDISASCGSQVVYDGDRLSPDKKYQRGVGVTVALLRRNGFYVIAQRDYRSLELLYAKIDPSYTPDPNALDHHETKWVKEYFQTPGH